MKKRVNSIEIKERKKNSMIQFLNCINQFDGESIESWRIAIDTRTVSSTPPGEIGVTQSNANSKLRIGKIKTFVKISSSCWLFS